MPLHTTLLSRTPHNALFSALVGALYVLVILLLPIPPMQRYTAALFGVWLGIVSLIRYVTLRAEPPTEALRSIPLRFSGELGRFRLRPRGDGRRVEVRAGSELVAEAIATDDGDELVLHAQHVADSELGAFGTAIGQAIEMAAVADADHPAERRRAGPARWGRA